MAHSIYKHKIFIVNMLAIQNTQKLIGQDFEVGDDVWTIESVSRYSREGDDVYQISLRSTQLQYRRYDLTKEHTFSELSANYKIENVNDFFGTTWVKRANVSNVTSMLRTLKRIISHDTNN